MVAFVFVRRPSRPRLKQWHGKEHLLLRVTGCDVLFFNHIRSGELARQLHLPAS